MSSQADAASDEDERDWSEWGDGDDDEATKSLFSDQICPSAQQALFYDAREHGFDLRHFRSQVGICGLTVLGSPLQQASRFRFKFHLVLLRAEKAVRLRHHSLHKLYQD